jgi:hypothetical protein
MHDELVQAGHKWAQPVEPGADVETHHEGAKQRQREGIERGKRCCAAMGGRCGDRDAPHRVELRQAGEGLQRRIAWLKDEKLQVAARRDGLDSS